MLKRISLTIVVFSLMLGICAGAASANEALGPSGHSDRNFAIVYNPLTALFGAHLLGFEMKMSDEMALVLTAGYINTDWTIKPNFNSHPGSFFELIVQGKFMVTGSVLDHGLYVSNEIFASYGSVPAASVGPGYGPNSWILGSAFKLGYESVTDFGLLMDFHAGLLGYLGWNFPNSTPVGTDVGSYYLTMWNPLVGGNLGYAW